MVKGDELLIHITYSIKCIRTKKNSTLIHRCLVTVDYNCNCDKWFIPGRDNDKVL